MPDIQYDVFISYATEDREYPVRVLVAALAGAGLTVWYDETSLTVGDGLRRSIDRGLASSRYGIVVLSRNFFSKQWPQWELDGLVQRQMAGEKVILPIWHGVDAKEIAQYSPPLANIVAACTNYGFGDVITKLLLVFKKANKHTIPIRTTSRMHLIPESRRVIAHADLHFDKEYLHFKSILKNAKGHQLRAFLLENPHLLRMIIDHPREVAIQTLVPLSDNFTCDALALYVPQWTELILISLGPLTPPPISKGIWSEEFAETVGALCSWKEYGSRELIRSIALDVGKSSNDDSEVSLSRFAEGSWHSTKIKIVAGFATDKDEKARQQLHNAIPYLTLISYDTLFQRFQRSTFMYKHADLSRNPISLLSMQIGRMEFRVLALEIDEILLERIRGAIPESAEYDCPLNTDIEVVAIRFTARSDIEEYQVDSEERGGLTSRFKLGISDSETGSWRKHSDWYLWHEFPTSGTEVIIELWGTELDRPANIEIVIDSAKYHFRDRE